MRSSGTLPDRVLVHCVPSAHDGREETLTIPIKNGYAANWKIRDLLAKVRSRVRHVPPLDLQEIENADEGDKLGVAGTLHEDDLLSDVLREGEWLLCSPDSAGRQKRHAEQARRAAQPFGVNDVLCEDSYTMAEPVERALQDRYFMAEPVESFSCGLPDLDTVEASCRNVPSLDDLAMQAAIVLESKEPLFQDLAQHQLALPVGTPEALAEPVEPAPRVVDYEMMDNQAEPEAETAPSLKTRGFRQALLTKEELIEAEEEEEPQEKWETVKAKELELFGEMEETPPPGLSPPFECADDPTSKAPVTVYTARTLWQTMWHDQANTASIPIDDLAEIEGPDPLPAMEEEEAEEAEEAEEKEDSPYVEVEERDEDQEKLNSTEPSQAPAPFSEFSCSTEPSQAPAPFSEFSFNMVPDSADPSVDEVITACPPTEPPPPLPRTAPPSLSSPSVPPPAVAPPSGCPPVMCPTTVAIVAPPIVAPPIVAPSVAPPIVPHPSVAIVPHPSVAPPPVPPPPPRRRPEQLPLHVPPQLIGRPLKRAVEVEPLNGLKRPVEATTNGGSESELKKGKWTPFLRAVYDGDYERTRDLMAQGVDVNETMTGAGQKTAIYYSIVFEHVSILQLLLSAPDIDIHRQMRRGRSSVWTTPLDTAKDTGPGHPVYKAFACRNLFAEKKPLQLTGAPQPAIVAHDHSENRCGYGTTPRRRPDFI